MAASTTQGPGFGRSFTPHMVVARWDAKDGWGSHEVVARDSLTLDPAAAVLHYGQSLFEGLKAFRGDDGQLRAFRLDAHLDRMRVGAARLAMPEIDVRRVRGAVLELLKRDAHLAPTDGVGSLYLRPILFGEEAFLGVRPSNTYTLLVLGSIAGNYYDGGMRPLRLWVERDHVRAAPGGLGAVKASANYAASLQAAALAKAKGFDQVLWLDAVTRTRVEEAGTMNVFVQIGDRVITPSLDGTILPGITRASCIALLRDRGVIVEERPIGLTEIETAAQNGTLKGVFGTGTAAVIAPVGLLGLGDRYIEVPVGKGDVAPLLLDALTGVQRGRVAPPAGWINIVD